MIGARVLKNVDPRTSIGTLKLKQSQGENYFVQKTFCRNEFTANQIEILVSPGGLAVTT